MAEIQYILLEDVKQVKNDNVKNIKTKICTKCGDELPATTEFFHKGDSKYGLKSYCKECVKKHYKLYKEKILSQQKIYYQNNKDKISRHGKIYYKLNKEKIRDRQKAYDKIYIKKNKDKISLTCKKREQSYALYNTYANNKSLILVEIVRRDPDNKDLLQVKCAYCNKWFNPINSQVRCRIKVINGKATGESRFYCNNNNNACKEACPIYHKEKWPKGFKRATSREVSPDLRQMCFERDSWECQKCGASIQDVTLHCHHIKGYTQNKILANDIDNVITLCKECHKEIHSQEGCKYHELQCHNE